MYTICEPLVLNIIIAEEQLYVDPSVELHYINK